LSEGDDGSAIGAHDPMMESRVSSRSRYSSWSLASAAGGAIALVLSWLAAHTDALAAFHVLFVAALCLCALGLSLGLTGRQRGASWLGTAGSIFANVLLVVGIAVYIAWIGIGRW
jgi:hypothetical protein